ADLLPLRDQPRPHHLPLSLHDALPISELDIWAYIQQERIPLPSIYYGHQREVVRRDGMLLANTRHLKLTAADEPFTTSVRFRTRSEEHTSELQSRFDLVCRLLLEKKKL